MSNQMNESESRAKLDQSMAEIADTWPAMMFRVYKNLKTEGFTHDDSMFLTSEFMRNLITAGGDKAS